MKPSSDKVNEETEQRPQRVYESAIDWWVAVLLIMTPVTAAGIGGYFLWIGQPGDAATLFAAGALALLITLALTLPCRYTLLEDALSIRCGLICYQVPLDDIQTVEPTASLRSGPALSLRRVAVKTDRRTIILSPNDRDEFIADLLAAKQHP